MSALFVVLSSLAFGGACCGDGALCGDSPPDAGLVADAPAPFSTPGCEVDTIASTGDARGTTTCATCASSTGDVEICGTPDVARCESREDARGAACSFCATPAGEILYDSCFSDEPPPSARCEQSQDAPAAPDDPSPAEGAEDDLVCETCVDDAGNYVRSTCEPVSDECHVEEADGQSCRVCTRAGETVVRDCEQP